MKLQNKSIRKVLSFIELSRPVNGLIAFISVFLGALLAADSLSPLINVLIVAIAALMLLSAGNALNDFCDLQIDKINKPHRPIPSGRIERKEALTFSIVLLGIGTCMGMLINWTAFVIAVTVSATLVLYSTKLKRMPLAGNIAIGFLTALVFTSGGVAVDAIKGTIVPALFAFLFTTAREIIKDIEDLEGDRKMRARTSPILWGEDTAMYIAFGFMASVIILSFIPYLIELYSWRYMLLVFLGVDCVLIYCMRTLKKNPSSQNAGKIQKLMKLDIFVGLGAILLG